METLKKVAIVIGTAGITVIVLLLAIGILPEIMRNKEETKESAQVEETIVPVETPSEIPEETPKLTPTPKEISTPVPVPTIVETEVPKDNTYIIVDSNSRVLSDAEVSVLDENTKQMAINEIYARHGRKFKDQAIQEYFNQKAWYVPSVEPDSFDESVFNKYERSNITSLAGSGSTNGSAGSIVFGGTYSQTVSTDPYSYYTLTISLTEDAIANLTEYPVGYIVGEYTLNKTDYSADASWSASDYYDYGSIVKSDQNIYACSATYETAFDFQVLEADHLLVASGPAYGEFYLGDSYNYNRIMGTR